MSLHDTMKRFLTPALLCAPVLALCPTASAQEAPALTPEQTASIMKQLEQIEGQITKNRGDALGAALTRFRSAMAGDKEAIDLWFACTKLENFDKKDLKTTEFQTWKDQQENRVKDPDFPTGLRLQLEYLVLSIQAQDIKDIDKMGPTVAALQAYLPKAINAVQATLKHNASGAIEEKNPGGRGPGGGNRGGGGGPRAGGGGNLGQTLRQPVKGSIFSQAYTLDQLLNRQDWEYSPLNIGGIYRNVILPFYLDQKPAEVPAQYDAMINAELAMRKGTMSETEFAQYYKEEGPDLQWGKANYLLQHKITPVLAMADMLKIIRENPTHPKAGGWVKQLREAVNQTQIPTTPTSTEPAPAAPQT